VKQSLLTTFLLIFSTYAVGKIDPPNYNFSLKSFEKLMPGNKLIDAKKAYPKLAIDEPGKNTIVYKVMVAQLRYVFPVYLQVQDGIIIDFYARLPQYFLHDLFHQSLIDKIGMQNKYKRVDEHAIYIWNKKGSVHIYEGACTITCFPIYYSSYLTNKVYEPLIKRFNKQAVKSQNMP
jgi:hypothetical protein